MSKLIKKVLSVSLCAAMLTGTAALGSLSVSATNGPMKPFEKVEVYDDGEETYHIGGGSIAFYPLNENGYYKWNWMSFTTEVNYLYDEGKVYNSEKPYEDKYIESMYYGGIKGAYYDLASNTLYLRNVDQPLMGLEITAMGKDFKINVAGECKLAFIMLNGYYENDPECAGLTITGNGVLTLDTSNFGSTYNPISAYVSAGENGLYDVDSDVRIRFDKNVSLNIRGKDGRKLVSIEGTTCNDPKLAIEAGNGQNINVESENVSYEESLDKTGVYMTYGGTYVYDYIASKKSDPNGIYSVYSNNWNDSREEDEAIFYQPRKYKYIQRFDAYIQDDSFESEKMTPKEFAAADYTIQTINTPEIVNYNSEEEPQANWRYVGYRVTNDEDVDSDYIYVTGTYAYGKTESEKHTNYSVYELNYDPENDSYSRASEDAVFTLNDETFEQGGFSMIMEEGSDIKAKEVRIPVPDEPNTYYVYDLINNPDDPNGIYGIASSFYKPFDPTANIYIKRVRYNDEYERYIEDEDFSESMLVSEFLQSKYKYVYIDEPVGMQAYNTFYANDVYKDVNGNKYLYYKSWDKDYVFTYSEDDLVELDRGRVYYALTPIDDISADQLTESIIVRDDLFNYRISGTELKYGSGTAGFANTSYLSTYETVVGNNVTLNAASVGGTGDKTYALMYRKSGETTFKKIGTKYGTASTGSFKPDSTGTYEVMINVKDSTGKIVSASFNVDVVSELKNTSTINTDEIIVGQEVKLAGNAEGGLAPYKFIFYYKKSKNTDWIAIKDNAIEDDVATFVPSSKVAYDFKVVAIDRDGRQDETVFKAEPAGPLQNLSTISSENISLGESVYIHAQAKGGAGGYTYALLYKKSSSSTWLKIGTKYGTNPDGSFKPGKAVPYDVMVNIKDSKGTVKSKTFKVTVSNALVNKSTINAQSVKVGEKVVMKGVATGGSGPYTYSFFYKKSKNSTWVTISEDTAKYGSFKPTAATEYDAKVVAKDSTGKTVEKNFKVTVTK